jgi:hypothetical protein
MRDDKVDMPIPPILERTLMEEATKLNEVPAPISPQERAEFATIGKRALDAMVQAAEQVVTDAQNMVAEIKLRRAAMVHELEEHEQRLAEMTQRMRAFGELQLEAHRTFLGENDPKQVIGVDDQGRPWAKFPV